MKTQGAVLVYLWLGSELPMWTLYLSSPQLHPIWNPTEPVAASVSLSTCQGPVILGEIDNGITMTNRRPPTCGFHTLPCPVGGSSSVDDLSPARLEGHSPLTSYLCITRHQPPMICPPILPQPLSLLHLGSCSIHTKLTGGSVSQHSEVSSSHPTCCCPIFFVPLSPTLQNMQYRECPMGLV